ncbi:hypothetical protein [Phyllobacterium chamaecytisi]|uniref:hypothetical protein n=1 Tax=Phyllobacterium chamaecytisi TaxID=2876082 RepID=UPI001CCA1366|nr:hypothetical protein [Phyllobacterium sp. KW56]MBZ9605720.1 hypothetical protein [Phyllobacterium sp. KW56]
MGWSFLLGHSDFRRGEFNSVEDDEQEAANKIKAAFARYLEYPSDNGGGRDLPSPQSKARSKAYANAKGS